MQAHNKALLLALGFAALLVLSSVPVAEAARPGRTLQQWGLWGGMWGPFWGGGDPSSPSKQ